MDFRAYKAHPGIRWIRAAAIKERRARSTMENNDASKSIRASGESIESESKRVANPEDYYGGGAGRRKKSELFFSGEGRRRVCNWLAKFGERN